MRALCSLLLSSLVAACTSSPSNGTDSEPVASARDASAEPDDMASPSDATPPTPSRCSTVPACQSLTYLGIAVSELAFASDGALLVAGSAPSLDLDGVSVLVLGEEEDAGLLLRMDPGALEILAAVRMGSRIDDVAVRGGTGDVAIVSDAGVAVLTADLAAVRWHSGDLPTGGSLSLTASEGRRIAVDAVSGIIAALNLGTVQVFESDGAVRGAVRVLEDISVVDRNARIEDLTVAGDRLLVAGWSQPCTSILTPLALSMPVDTGRFGEAGVHDGTFDWERYNWRCVTLEAGGATGDGRLFRIVAHGDQATLLGSGNGLSAFFRQPDPNASIANSAGNSTSDAFDTPDQLTEAPYTYTVQLGIDEGAFVRGILHSARASNGDSGALVPRGLAVGDDGEVLIAGQAGFAIDGRSFDGRPASGYEGAEAFALLLSADFSQRLRWEVYTAGPGGSAASAAALTSGRYAVAGSSSADLLVTDDALSSDREGDTGFVLGFPR